MRNDSKIRKNIEANPHKKRYKTFFQTILITFPNYFDNFTGCHVDIFCCWSDITCLCGLPRCVTWNSSIAARGSVQFVKESRRSLLPGIPTSSKHSTSSDMVTAGHVMFSDTKLKWGDFSCTLVDLINKGLSQKFNVFSKRKLVIKMPL